MVNPTRRSFLTWLGGGVAAAFTLADADPVLAGSGSYTLGLDLFAGGVKETYEGKTPESQKDELARLGKSFWNADDIEKAFAATWEKVKDYPSAVAMAEQYRNGDKAAFNELTTSAGNELKSVLTAMNEAFDNDADRALHRMVNSGKISNDFHSIKDVGLQAFILRVGDKPERASFFDTVGDSLGVKDIAKNAWQKGFEQFVRNTLEPSLAIAPIVKPALPRRVFD